MSRVGKTPIAVPEGVEVSIDGAAVTVSGSRGTLARELPGDIRARLRDGEVIVERPDETTESKALHGLSRSLVNNMVLGVSEGFAKELQIQGVGYRVDEEKFKEDPSTLVLLLGFSHAVSVKAPEGIAFDLVNPKQILVTGIDKQLVGQVAADIRKWRKPEPYKGKGIRYAGERVLRKAGKAAK